jgi:hypothetical protein
MPESSIKPLARKLSDDEGPAQSYFTESLFVVQSPAVDPIIPTPEETKVLLASSKDSHQGTTSTADIADA